jgi:hypothetical protein
MRWIIAAAFLVAAGSAHAQTAPAAPAAAPAASPAAQTAPAAAPTAAPHVAHHRRTRQQQFDAANTTHDGHLTEEQARAGMPAVARNFAAIDTAKKGYVTMDDIKAYYANRRAARRAAAAAKKQN